MFDECRKKQNDKQDMINNFTKDLNKINKNLQMVKAQMETLIAPDSTDGHAFV